MKFLYPSSYSHPGAYGFLVSPSTRGIPTSVQKGSRWACDNNAYTMGYQPERLLEYVETLRDYKDNCLFITIPDSVGDAAETIEYWHECKGLFKDWPVAFVAQDGVRVSLYDGHLYVGDDRDFTDYIGDEYPDTDPEDDPEYYDIMDMWRSRVEFDDFDVLFIGGSTEWKLSKEADLCIKIAQEHGKRIHVGRVNWWQRYSHFRLLEGSEDFTCDGTRPRYGKDKTLKDWLRYEKQPPLFKI